MQIEDLYYPALILNLNRFTGDSVSYHRAETLAAIPDSCYISQAITGDCEALTALYGSPENVAAFALAYSKMEPEEIEGAEGELAADFLNMHNGLFIVNLSDYGDTECSLGVPQFTPGGEALRPYDRIRSMQVDFSFGPLFFLLSEREE